MDIDKYAFEVKEVKYLGFIIEAEKGIRADPEKITAIAQWEAPTTVRGVRGFIGFANYYRDFVPDFADMARPLIALTRKGVQFDWMPTCQQAFNELKNHLIAVPILAH